MSFKIFKENNMLTMGGGSRKNVFGVLLKPDPKDVLFYDWTTGQELAIVPKPKTNMSTTIEKDSNGIYYLSQPFDGARGFTGLDLTQYPVYYWDLYMGFSFNNAYLLGGFEKDYLGQVDTMARLALFTRYSGIEFESSNDYQSKDTNYSLAGMVEYSCHHHRIRCSNTEPWKWYYDGKLAVTNSHVVPIKNFNTLRLNDVANIAKGPVHYYMMRIQGADS